MDGEDVWERFSAVVRSMSEAPGVTGTLQSAVDAAVRIIGHADSAGISMVYRGKRIETPAATGDIPRRGDQLQYELGEGPCLQSIYEQETVHSGDLSTETRWPTWSRRAAAELGVRSMLCFQLFVTHDTLGALNLYANDVGAFDAEDRASGLALSAHIAVALSAAHQEEDLQSIIVRKTVIAHAEGMLMQRYGLTAEQAFSVLTNISTQSENKLSEVASDLVRNGIKTTSA